MKQATASAGNLFTRLKNATVLATLFGGMMDFDDWWERQGLWPSEYTAACAAWQTAQQAERERAKECITELLDYAQHDSWRCGYNNECHCGLNTITERFGLPAVPLPEKGEAK